MVLAGPEWGRGNYFDIIEETLVAAEGLEPVDAGNPTKNLGSSSRQSQKKGLRVDSLVTVHAAGSTSLRSRSELQRVPRSNLDFCDRPRDQSALRPAP